MRRTILFLVFSVCSVPLFSTPEAFEDLIDFSISTSDLVEIVRAEQYDLLQPGKYNILSGSVASTMILDPNVETFQALVELVQGEWIGLAEIEVYRVYVLLNGPDYSNRVLERLPREPGPEVILTNQELLVVGEFVGVADGAGGVPIPVVNAIAVR